MVTARAATVLVIANYHNRSGPVLKLANPKEAHCKWSGNRN